MFDRDTFIADCLAAIRTSQPRLAEAGATHPACKQRIVTMLLSLPR